MTIIIKAKHESGEEVLKGRPSHVEAQRTIELLRQCGYTILSVEEK